MGLRPHRRDLVVFSSSAGPAGRYGALAYRRPTAAGRIRRSIRIGLLLTVIAVRPRWRPLLAGAVLTGLGFLERQGLAGICIIPGLLLLWRALLTSDDTRTAADRERLAQLRRELAAFSTPAQRCDLEAVLSRYPDGVTYEMRSILARQAVIPPASGIPGRGSS